jgi:threonyl-tRNA synthetase
MQSHQVRCDVDRSYDKINGKIQRAEQMKVHSMFVIGKRDMEADAVSVRVHGKGNLGARPRGSDRRNFIVDQRTTRRFVIYFASAWRFCFRLARIPAARCESGSALAD